MIRYRHLRVTGTKETVGRILQQMLSRQAGGWRRSVAREESIRAVSDLFCFEYDGAHGVPGATVWVSTKDDGQVLYETTIVPTIEREISVEQCNAVLESFVDHMVRPLTNESNVLVELTSAEPDLRDHMSAPVEKRLRAFSSAANKTTGGTHPMDRQRWLEFLLAAHRENIDWSSEDLHRWLVEDGWEEDVADGLAVQYDLARDLLRAADGRTA